MLSKVTAGLTALLAIVFSLFKVERSKRRQAELDALKESRNREMLEKEKAIIDKATTDYNKNKNELDVELVKDEKRIKELQNESNNHTVTDDIVSMLNSHNGN